MMGDKVAKALSDYRAAMCVWRETPSTDAEAYARADRQLALAERRLLDLVGVAGMPADALTCGFVDAWLPWRRGDGGARGVVVSVATWGP